ncbi:MAG: hypothetical protein K2I99_01905 [Bacteroidaceae bacterium]|nr:hypothetical protein [Bacteroidaceae bacterium]
MSTEAMTKVIANTAKLFVCPFGSERVHSPHPFSRTLRNNYRAGYTIIIAQGVYVHFPTYTYCLSEEFTIGAWFVWRHQSSPKEQTPAKVRAVLIFQRLKKFCGQ